MGTAQQTHIERHCRATKSPERRAIMVFIPSRVNFYMRLSSSNSSYFKWIIIFMFFYICVLTQSDPRISEARLLCGRTRASPNTDFIQLFVKVMETLSQQVNSQNWGSHALNSSTASIYSLAHCYRDLSHDDCLQCYAASRTRLPRCIPDVGGRLFLDGCFLRYDNYSFFGEAVDPKWDIRDCNSSIVDNPNENQFSRSDFNKSVEDLIDNITARALLNDGYAVAGLKGVYGLADCWRTLSTNSCRECLTAARREVIGCLPGREGRALNTGNDKVKILSWKERYDIIVGTAEGIAGTLGYMAPEYLVKGQLTEKADVYSFGVLVLEITCNRKSNAFVEDSGSLLQSVWKQYKSDRLTEPVDPSLKGDFPEFEALRVLKIGLLCTQALALSRPSMSEVVRMLTDFDCEIPEPNQPPFLNSSLLSTTSTRSTYSMNSLASNAQTRFEAFYTSTESSIQSSEELHRQDLKHFTPPQKPLFRVQRNLLKVKNRVKNRNPVFLVSIETPIQHSSKSDTLHSTNAT
ncbi:unnamed protein product [Fraxinus pennsylvanica]|uniref:Gnk2-homologous domain-containing protein n=1 Tax=Fraxinus pennsylvanica TaxID=56036 RepID=A0AAD1YWA2_9LAMI|nr:unnamed protein product [Fraxinus pennsylvanica]